MITLQELKLFLNELLANPDISDYSPNGVQVEGKERIARIATGVSANLVTIEAAVQQEVDALIVHHGLFWKGDSYVITGPKKEKIDQLLKHEITLFAYHLPLDAHQRVGNNWKAAKEMGWIDLEPFGYINGTPIGVKGKIKKRSREEFKNQLEDYYSHQAHTALGGPEEVSSVGLVSGGAYKLIPDAALAELDCFVTGNFDEPAWSMAHEHEVNFFALGHTATERVGPIALADELHKELDIETLFLDSYNPF